MIFNAEYLIAKIDELSEEQIESSGVTQFLQGQGDLDTVLLNIFLRRALKAIQADEMIPQSRDMMIGSVELGLKEFNELGDSARERLLNLLCIAHALES